MDTLSKNKEEFPTIIEVLRQDAFTGELPPISSAILSGEPEVSVDTPWGGSRKVFPLRKAGYAAAAGVMIFIAGSLFYKWNFSDSTGGTKPLSAVVARVQGSVILQNTDKQLKTGDVLVAGATVQTGDAASAEILFQSGATVHIKAQSKLVLNELLQKDDGRTSIRMGMQSGETVHIVNRLYAEDVYTVTTPTAIAGVRGTTFSVKVDPKVTAVTTTEGAVEVTAFEDQAQNVILPAGMSVEIRQGEKLPAAHKTVLPDTSQEKQIIESLQTNLNSDLSNLISAKKLSPVHSEKEIDRIYNRGIEIIHLSNGEVIRGVVVGQNGSIMVVHTVQGSRLLNSSEVKEIKYDTIK